MQNTSQYKVQNTSQYNAQSTPQYNAQSTSQYDAQNIPQYIRHMKVAMLSESDNIITIFLFFQLAS